MSILVLLSLEYVSVVFDGVFTITMCFSNAATAPSGRGGIKELTDDIEISSDSETYCKTEISNLLKIEIVEEN